MPETIASGHSGSGDGSTMASQRQDTHMHVDDASQRWVKTLRDGNRRAHSAGWVKRADCTRWC